MTTYLMDSEGKFIPATQRPDGTWRKARRVKDGYVPQEEVPLYESKGKQFAQRRSTLPPGMCPIGAEQARQEREKQERAKAKKLAKQQQQQLGQTNALQAGGNVAGGGCSQNKLKPKQQQTPGMLVLPSGGAATSSRTMEATATTTKTMITNSNESAVTTKLANDLETKLKLQPTAEESQQMELAKKLKKLRKKLREIETIEQRLKSGELKKPEKDQLDKVKRKKEIVKEIKLLEEEEEAAASALGRQNVGSGV